MMFQRRAIAVVAAVGGLALGGCVASTTTTVIQKPAPSPSSPPGSTVSSSGSSGSQTPANPVPPARPQVFHGSGQQALGTIAVPADSTISWNCPGCGGTNFIIHNAHSDDSDITTNALNQTQGVDPISAGTYNTVVVDTTGGAWTVAIGAKAQPPSGSAQSSQGSSSSGGTDPTTPPPGGAPPGTVTGQDAAGKNIGVGCSDDQSSPLPGCDDSPSYNQDGTRQQPQ
jgi:hypothetical protein